MHGLGRAFRDVKPEESELVVQLVLNDPRWDRQLEQREAYYATLLQALDADINPLAIRILETPEDESDLWLCADVLAQLAWRGSADAAVAVNRGIAEGVSWRQLLDALDALGGESLLRDVVQVNAVATLLERVGTSGFEDAVRAVSAPWDEWAVKVSGLRFLLAGADSAPRFSGTMPLGRVMHRLGTGEIPAFDASCATSQLIEFGARHPGTGNRIIKLLGERRGMEHRRALLDAASSAPARERTIALRVLAREGNQDFVSAAVEFHCSQTRLADHERGTDALMRRAYSKYLEELPIEVSLPLAREWLLMPWPLSYVGEHILADHATGEDRVTLESECGAALERGDMYRVCSLVEGLGTIADSTSLPVLLAVHDEAPYSKARERVISRLHRFRRTDLIERVLVDALWDCEDATRTDAAEAVPLTIETRRRLSDLATDRFEDEEVREAAASRLV